MNSVGWLLADWHIKSPETTTIRGKRYFKDSSDHIPGLIGKHNGRLPTLYKLMCVLPEIKLKFFQKSKVYPAF
jgi:hypothetical protein